MKKINKKALFGVGAGIVAAVVGACCLFKKKSNEDYNADDICCDEEDADVNEDADSEED